MRTFLKLGLCALFAAVALGGLSAQAATTLTVEVFDRATPGYSADNNFLTQWIQEKVKKELNIDVKFVTVPRGQEVDKLNILMAAGQAPDISFTYNEGVVTNYVKSGGLVDLGPLLAQYGKNLTAYLGDDLLDFGNWGGKQWSVPAKRVLQATFSGFIRKDWLDKLGLPVPKTLDDFYKTMKAFKDKDPGNTGGKVIPFGLSIDPDPNNATWTSSMILEAFKKPVSEEDRFSLNNWVYPGFKEGVRFLNKLYNEGLISPQFALDKDGKQYEKDIVQGRMGALIGNFDLPYRPVPGWTTELAKNVPGANLVPFDAFENSQGKHVKMKYNPNGFFIFVPKFSKNAVAAVKYLNWLSNPDVIKFLQNGIKGQQYLNEKNGIPVDFVANDKLPDEKKYNFTDLAILANGKEFGSFDKNMEAAALGYTGYEEQFKQAYSIAMKDALYMPRFDVIIDSQAKLGQVLAQKGAELFVKSILAKPSDFDATYDSLVAEYQAAGGQKVIDEKRLAYKAMMAAKGK